MAEFEFYAKVARRFFIALFIITTFGLVTVFAHAQSDENTIGVQPVLQGLTAPVALASANDGSGRLFVVDQTGLVWILTSSGDLLTDPFLDIRGLLVPLMPDYDERGLLGLAFHPDYANNGRFFVYYTAPLRANAPVDWDHTNVLSEFSVSVDNPNVADPATERIVLQIDQPQFNHDAGHIVFGPDGLLYIPIGDGGGANDNEMGHTPNLGNGQDLSNLHGSILRIDVNGTPGNYVIPADNPFVTTGNAAPEIFAYGFRNPYHISFDRGGNNELFVADAGQDLYEEVSMVALGGNYGWNIKEGVHCFDPNNPEQPPQTCAATGANGEPLVDPIIEYSHDDVGIVVVGGYMYRGSVNPDLVGRYIFGDYTTSQDGPPDGTLLWAEPPAQGDGLWTWGELTVAGGPNSRIGAFVRAIGEDENGELYILTSNSMGPTGTTGMVWRVVPAGQGVVPVATETPSAGATATPIVSSTPSSTVNPEETATSEVTSEPEETATSEVTPEETISPEETATSEVTTSP